MVSLEEKRRSITHKKKKVEPRLRHFVRREMRPSPSACLPRDVWTVGGGDWVGGEQQDTCCKSHLLFV